MPRNWLSWPWWIDGTGPGHAAGQIKPEDEEAASEAASSMKRHSLWFPDLLSLPPQS
jgi:hypothetical protein